MNRTQIDFIGLAIIILHAQLMTAQGMASMWHMIANDNRSEGKA